MEYDKAIELLIQSGCDVNIVKKDGWTALMLASQNGDIHALELLIKSECDVNDVNSKHWTALMLASARGHEKAIHILIQSGSHVNAIEKDGWTAFMFASAKGHVKAIELLIQNNCEVNAVNKKGWNALMLASQNGHENAIELLIQSGCDTNLAEKHGWTALMLASQNGHDRTTDLLIKNGGKVNIYDKDGWTALMLASQNGHEKVIQLLIQAKCHVNICDTDGWNALMLASQNGHEKAMDLLIQSGCNVNAVNIDGRTALILASQNGHEKAIELLIQNGCDVKVVDKDGFSALKWASENEDEKATELLINSLCTFKQFDFDVTNILISCIKIVKSNNQNNVENAIGLLLNIAEYDPLILKRKTKLIKTLETINSHATFTTLKLQKTLSCIFWHVNKSSLCLDQNLVKYLSPYVPTNWETTQTYMGQGASGFVYEVQSDDILYNTKLAVKELYFAKQNMTKLLTEASITLKLHHRSVIQFFGFEIKERKLYLFFEYMTLGSLSDYVKKNGLLNETKVFSFTNQILEGVSYLHNFDPPVIHRDIKGANILLKDENTVKLADFGISKILESTFPKSVVGTTKFMAPEVVLADEKTAYTVKADIWSVGCTVVEMVTGKPPCSDLLDPQIVWHYAQKKRPVYDLPTSTSMRIKEILDQSLNMNPNERPTADELLRSYF